MAVMDADARTRTDELSRRLFDAVMRHAAEAPKGSSPAVEVMVALTNVVGATIACFGDPAPVLEGFVGELRSHPALAVGGAG